MNNNQIFEILNTAPVFGVLTAIAFGIILLGIKKDPSRPQKSSKK